MLPNDGEAPDEHVALIARTRDLCGQPVWPGAKAPYLAAPVAPGDASSVAKFGDALPRQRQAGRGRKAFEQSLIGVVGADEAAGAIGDRHGVGARLRDRAGEGPIDRRRRRDPGRRQHPPRNHRACGHDPRGDEPCRGDDAADQPQHERRGHHRRSAGDERSGPGGVQMCRKGERGHARPSSRDRAGRVKRLV